MKIIDAEMLFNDIEFRTVNCQNDLSLEDLEWIKEEIDNQPTAYDIDKVVEELEARKEFCKGEWETFNNEYYRGRYNSLVDAIEIVKVRRW